MALYGRRQRQSFWFHCLANALIIIAVLATIGIAPAQTHASGLLNSQLISTDTIRNSQWYLGFLRIEDAWQLSRGAGQIVAVIDSGVDADHPDLVGQVLPGADFVDGSTDGRDDIVGHGTTVAALIAGQADERGVSGIAPEAKILPARVLNPTNEYDSADRVAEAVYWAVDHGATIINLSLGSSEDSVTLAEAVTYAIHHDVVVVACDGNVSNDRGSQVWHPARQPGVIAVSGVNSDSSFWQGSLFGPETVLAAPATNIIGPSAEDGYWQVQGTSFAAPLVAASAALVRAKFPSLDAGDVINRLIRTAWDLGTPGRDNEYGFGIVNPTGALTAAIRSIGDNPLLKDKTGGSGHLSVSPGHPSLSDSQSQQGVDQKDFVWTKAVTIVGVLVLLGTIGMVLVSRKRHRANRSLGYLPPGASNAPDPPPEQPRPR